VDGLVMFLAPVQVLPSLRQELRLIEGALDADGEPTWLIYDPLQNRHIQIDRSTYALLAIWNEVRMVPELAALALARFDLRITAEDVGRLVDFLEYNSLTVAPRQGGWRTYDVRSRAGRHGILAQMAHTYLFLRLPLLKPDRFLDATAWLVAPLYTRAARHAFTVLAMLAVYLISRQWDAFATSAAHLMSLSGAVQIVVGLLFGKLVHEFGHAYTARRYGCTVPTMGMAVMLGAPMPYADVTDAWRLPERRKRMAIDAAGMIAEMGLGVLAALAWVFLPPGDVRNIALVLATTAPLMTLVVNLNPLMRFDGYYLCSDVLGIDNLQVRAFALARWRLREVLFGLGEAPPEKLEPRLQRTITAFGLATLLYRLVLYLGIAWAVYLNFFKLLGIALFVFEIVVFIVSPLRAELAAWWAMRRKIMARRRTWLTASVVATLTLFVVLPWSTTVRAPAIAEADRVLRIFPVEPGRIERVHVLDGWRVAAGDALFELGSPRIDSELQLVRARLRLVKLRLARRAADDGDRGESLVLERELSALSKREEGLLKERDALVHRAQFDGEIRIASIVQEGRIVGAKDELGILIAPGSGTVRGYLAEQDVHRVSSGARGRFVPDTSDAPSYDVSIIDVATAAAATLDILEVSSTYGGAIATTSDRHSGQVSSVGQYGVRARVVHGGEQVAKQRLRGVIVFSATAESLALRGMRHVARVLIRESGF
jgi:putative peptide zinc metalloprotease protein